MPNRTQPVPVSAISNLSRNRKFLLFGGLLLSVWVLVVVIRIGHGNDFVSFYAAGWLARTHPSHLYLLSSQLAAQSSAGGTYPMPWLHPAPEALLFAPLTYLAPSVAFELWSAVSVAMLGVVLWLLRADILALPHDAHYALIAFLYAPLIFGLRTGQDHVLFLLLWALAYRNLRNEKPVMAGVFIGLSLIRYQFALPVLLLLVVMRAWKTVFTAASVGVALLAASFLMVGRDLIPTYTSALRLLAFRHDPLSVGSMPTLRGMLSHLPHTTPLLLIADAALLVWAALSVLEMTRPDGMLLALPIALLVDFHGFSYALVVLTLPIIIVLRRNHRASWILWGCFACYVLSNFSIGFESVVGLFVLSLALTFQRSAPVLQTNLDDYADQP